MTNIKMLMNDGNKVMASTAN